MPSTKSIILNPNKWSYEDFNDYVNATNSGNMELAFLILKDIIVDWEYDVSLDEERPDLSLPYTALPDIIFAVGKQLDAFYNDLNIVDDVTVDMKGWSMEDYYNYQTAAENNDLVAVEAFMKQVATPNDEDYDPSERLDFGHGLLMRKGIEKAQEALFLKRKTR
jgi:hypothetical protein